MLIAALKIFHYTVANADRRSGVWLCGGRYRYDPNGRLAFMQDGNMRAEGRAMFTAYDGAGRVAVTGMCDDHAMDDPSATIPSMTSPLDIAATGICGTGYLVPTHEFIQNATLLTAAYYDSYDFLSLPQFSGLPAQPVWSNCLGLPTGSITAILGGGDDARPIVAATYYDNEERPIKVVASTHVAGTYETTETTYTLDGLPKEVTHTVDADGTEYTDSYSYTYDSARRQSSVKARMEGVEGGVTVADNYNSIGRLTGRTIGEVETGYSYDIRGNVTSIETALQGYVGELNIAWLTYSYNRNGSVATAGDGMFRQRYGYDGAGRLTSSTWSSGSAPGRFFTSEYAYDRNTNLTSIRRRGLPDGIYEPDDLVDDLTLSYKGNRLVKVSDAADEVLQENSYDFHDGVDESTEYTYDANGNITSDLNRGITEITYNALNLPQTITTGEHELRYVYDATGRKLSQSLYYNYHTTPVLPPVQPATADLTRIQIEAIPPIEATEYIGNYEFDKEMSLTRVNTPYGFSDGERFNAYVYDRQGNVARVIRSDYASVTQTNSYYPYGLPTQFTNGEGSGNRYRYGGKELTTLKGLNLYDFAARTYAPDLGRFMQPDPSTHDYHWLSPYAYCGGDPVNFVDPTGEDFWHTTDISEITKFFNAVLGGNNFYDFSGWTHMSDIEFLNSLVYDDKAYKLYATTTSVVEGELIVNCAIYNIRIYPVISSRRQVHEPVNGLLDEICYALSPWTYFDGVTNWKVGKDGYISGIAPIIGYPPKILKGRIPIIGKLKMGHPKRNMPGNNRIQNKQIKYLAKKHHLTDDEIEILHREISHEGLGFHEIEEYIFDFFGK